MTWSSGSAERVPVLAAAVAALAAIGCAADEVAETQVIVFAETMACETASEADAEINVYEVVLFEFVRPETPDPEVGGCARCVGPEAPCPVVERQCRCAPGHRPRTVAINAALAGTSFSDLDSEAGYCVAMRGYSVRGVRTDPPAECDCATIESDGGLRPPCFVGFTPFVGRVGENSSAFILPGDCTLACLAGP